MTTSSFLQLTGGGSVRFDFQAPPAPVGAPSLAFQLLDAADQPTGSEVTVFTQLSSGLPQVDAFNAAALPGGGFVLAYEERDSLALPFPGATGPTEVLRALVVDAHGVIHDTFNLTIGAAFPDTTTIGAPSVFGLSGDGFALLYDAHNGEQVSQHLSLPVAGSSVLNDFALPSAPNTISTADGNLVLGFSNGDKVLAGGEMSSTLTGGAGDDTIFAGGHGDFIRGGDGADLIQGGAGFDNINGNQGDDTIDGGLGGHGDFLLGGQGDDLIIAHSGDGLLQGNLGNDTLNGGSGNEVLRGGQDNDVLNGGAGNDWLSGDRGDDTLTGGAGADIFHASEASGLDMVTDFNAAEGDRIQLDPGTTYTVAQSGADVVIDITVGGDALVAELVLKNVQLSTLPSDFIFLA